MKISNAYSKPPSRYVVWTYFCFLSVRSGSTWLATTVYTLYQCLMLQWCHNWCITWFVVAIIRCNIFRIYPGIRLYTWFNGHNQYNRIVIHDDPLDLDAGVPISASLRLPAAVSQLINPKNRNDSQINTHYIYI